MRKIYALVAAGMFAATGFAQNVVREVITEPDLEYPVSTYYDVTISGLAKDLRGGPETHFTDANGQRGEIVMDSRDPEAPVYLKNPLPRYCMGSYIEGRMVEDGDDIYLEFQLPQMIIVNNYGNGAMIAVGQIFEVQDATYYDPVSYEENLVRYVLDENENWVLDLPEGYALCNWLVAAEDTDYKQAVFWKDAISAATYSEPTLKLPTIMPEDANAEEYGMIFSNGGRTQLVNIGIVDDTLYVEGFDKTYPTACITGTINGDKVTFEGGQFIGLDDNYNYYLVFNEAELKNVNQYLEELWHFPGNVLPSIEASYDAENKIISCPIDIAWLSNVGTQSVYFKDFYVGPLFAPNANMPATPVDPEITELMDYEAGMGFGGIAFNLPLLGTENQVLNPNFYTYVVYFDNEPYTFSPVLYPGLESPMTEIPYDFNDEENEDIRAEGMEHVVIWKVDGYTSVGVQGIYTVGETVNKTEIITAKLGGDDEPDDTGVGNINGVDVADIEYFDFTGNKVVAPEKGMYIRKVTFTSGKTITDKIIVR